MAYSTPVQLIDGVLGTDNGQLLTFPNALVAGDGLLALVAGDASVDAALTIYQALHAGTNFTKIGGVHAAGPDLGIYLGLIASCQTDLSVDLEASTSGLTLGPAVIAYEAAYLKYVAAQSTPAATGSGSNSEATASIIGQPRAQAMFYAVACSVNDTALPSSVSGSNLGWSIDYQATLVKYPTTGDTSIPLGTKYVTFASALAPFADITADFGLCAGNWITLLWVAQLVVPAVTTINAVRVEDIKHYQSGAVDHFVLVYSRGNYDGSAFQLIADAQGYVDQALANTDTFAGGWGNLITALNTAEGTTFSMVNTGSETTGLGHFVNATGAFNNDPWFPDGLAGRLTVGSVLYH